jgi:hypothetical protein
MKVFFTKAFVGNDVDAVGSECAPTYYLGFGFQRAARHRARASVPAASRTGQFARLRWSRALTPSRLFFIFQVWRFNGISLYPIAYA